MYNNFEMFKIHMPIYTQLFLKSYKLYKYLCKLFVMYMLENASAMAAHDIHAYTVLVNYQAACRN